MLKIMTRLAIRSHFSLKLLPSLLLQGLNQKNSREEESPKTHQFDASITKGKLSLFRHPRGKKIGVIFVLYNFKPKKNFYSEPNVSPPI